MATSSYLISLKSAFFLAWKNISKNKSKVFLTIFIISLGFISSIIIYGVLIDIGNNLEQDYIDTSFGDIILEPFEHNAKIENTPNILDKINTLPDIEGAAAISKVSGRLYDKEDNYIDTQILIVNPADFEKASSISSFLYEGDYLGKRASNDIFMGCLNLKSCSKFADSMPSIDLDIGKETEAQFSSGERVNLTLVGNYRHSFALVESINVMSEDTAQRIFSDYDKTKADVIIIRVQNKEITQQVIRELAFLGVDAKISDWKEKLAFYTQTVDSFNTIGNLSFLIGVIISAISVYIIVYINALNKKVQIGIMRAIGVRSKIISLSYTLQGLIYGILGSILGILLTFLMRFYFILRPIHTSIGNLVPQVSTGTFVLVAIAIIIASTFTGYFASRRIIKRRILDSISND